MVEYPIVKECSKKHTSQVISIYERNNINMLCEAKGSRMLKDPTYSDILNLKMLEEKEDGTYLICLYGEKSVPTKEEQKRITDGLVKKTIITATAPLMALSQCCTHSCPYSYHF